MPDIAPGWQAEIERGPDWVFVRLHAPEQEITAEEALAEALWQRMQNEFAHRLVIELDELELVSSHLLSQLVKLHKRVSAQGGLLRISGISAANIEVLRVSRLSEFLPCYATREDAVMGHRPGLPR